MTLTLVTPPADVPVSLAEQKDYQNITSTSDDALVAALIRAATSYLDGDSGVLGESLMTQTWDYKIPAFRARLQLPLPPLSSVTSVKYTDTSDVEQTVSTDIYGVDTPAELVFLKDGQSWPSDVKITPFPITIRFVAGYGSWSDVPEDLRVAIQIIASHWYENRGSTGDASTIPDSALALIQKHKASWF